MYKKPVLIAEVGCNHKGDFEIAKSFIKVAADFCKIKFIKFQKRDFENFYTTKQLNEYYNSPFGNKFYDYRKKLELTTKQIKYIKKLGKKFNIIPFFTVLDVNSFKFI